MTITPIKEFDLGHGPRWKFTIDNDLSKAIRAVENKRGVEADHEALTWAKSNLTKMPGYAYPWTGQDRDTNVQLNFLVEADAKAFHRYLKRKDKA